MVKSHQISLHICFCIFIIAVYAGHFTAISLNFHTPDNINNTPFSTRNLIFKCAKGDQDSCIATVMTNRLNLIHKSSRRPIAGYLSQNKNKNATAPPKKNKKETVPQHQNNKNKSALLPRKNKNKNGAAMSHRKNKNKNGVAMSPRKNKNGCTMSPRKNKSGTAPPKKNKKGIATSPQKNKNGAAPPKKNKNGATPPKKNNNGANPPKKNKNGATPPKKHKKGATLPPQKNNKYKTARIAPPQKNKNDTQTNGCCVDHNTLINNNFSFSKQNAMDAITLEEMFKSLTANSVCTESKNACIDDNFATCIGGKFTLTKCGNNLKCHVLPLVNKPGTTIACVTDNERDARIKDALKS